MVSVGRVLVEVGHPRPRFAQHRPILAEFCPMLATCGQYSPILAPNRPICVEFWADARLLFDNLRVAFVRLMSFPVSWGVPPRDTQLSATFRVTDYNRPPRGLRHSRGLRGHVSGQVQRGAGSVSAGFWAQATRSFSVLVASPAAEIFRISWVLLGWSRCRGRKCERGRTYLQSY